MTSAVVALDIDLDRNPLLVSPTRRYVEGVLKRLVKDVDLVARAALVVHELLDNGAKYAPAGARIEFSLTLECGVDGSLVIRLTNQTTPAHVERLRRFVSEINNAADATALYVDMMCRDPLDRTVSGLGLARIRAEAEMSLDLIVAAETATIVASTAAPKQRAAA
jgi:two-component sensor histidine kinase